MLLSKYAIPLLIVFTEISCPSSWAAAEPDVTSIARNSVVIKIANTDDPYNECDITEGFFSVASEYKGRLDPNEMHLAFVEAINSELDRFDMSKMEPWYVGAVTAVAQAWGMNVPKCKP